MTHAQSKTNWVNPDMLSWARNQVGLSPDDVAQRLELLPETVRAWETGESEPGFIDLERLVDIYDCPLGYFFLEVPPKTALVSFDFRGVTKSKIPNLSYESRVRLSQFSRYVEYAKFLMESANIDWTPSVEKTKISDSVEEVASETASRLGITQSVRDNWSSGEMAFNSWHNSIENEAVLIFSLRLNPEEIRGASSWSEPHPPAILVNRSDAEAASGRLFTLLHEYAHLMLRNTEIVCDFTGQETIGAMETFANRFAAEAIIPQNRFKEYLKSQELTAFQDTWSDNLLDSIREPFKSSRDTVAILLEQMGLAPAGFYRRKRASWDKRKPFGRSTKPQRLTKVERKFDEMGSNFSFILNRAFQVGTVSSIDIAEILDIPVERTDEFLSLVS